MRYGGELAVAPNTRVKNVTWSEPAKKMMMVNVGQRKHNNISSGPTGFCTSDVFQ